MKYILKCILPLIMILSCVMACGSLDVEPPLFNADRAFGYLEQQVAFGPRVPGSDASSKCRDYFYRHFTGSGFEVDSQVSSFFDPYSSTEISLVNVIAGYKSPHPEAPGIVLMAHYDSRPRAEFAYDTSLASQPIDGANDGASGVAVLMEIANLIADKKPEYNVDLVLSDGEDWGKPGDHDYYLLGSRAFARKGIRGKYRFGIVIDMIGDRDQKIYREGYSNMYNLDLNDLVWKTAALLGITSFVDSVKYTVLDDHLPLNSGGVPTVDIIDFDYDYWHTEFDTTDKCSPQALANVGRVLAEIIYKPSLWPKK